MRYQVRMSSSDTTEILFAKVILLDWIQDSGFYTELSLLREYIIIAFIYSTHICVHSRSRVYDFGYRKYKVYGESQLFE